MAENTLQVYKENGKVQYSNTGLSLPIARTLVQMVLSGQSLYPKTGEIEVMILEGEEEKPLKLKTYQIDAWCRRGNVIPETGETLREVLDKAREEKRRIDRERRHTALLDKAEEKMTRTMNLRTTVPIRNMFGQIVKNEDGSVARRENHNVLRIQMDTAKYVTERLDPDRYSRVDKSENKHLHFSLADLRKAKQEQEEKEVEAQ